MVEDLHRGGKPLPKRFVAMHNTSCSFVLVPVSQNDKELNLRWQPPFFFRIITPGEEKLKTMTIEQILQSRPVRCPAHRQRPAVFPFSGIRQTRPRDLP